VCGIGSPFTIPVIDGRKAVASGECLGGVVMANKPCGFDVSTRMVNGDAPLFVGITCKSLGITPQLAQSVYVCH